MGKMTHYTLLLAGLSLMYYIFGLMPSNTFITALLNPTDIFNTLGITKVIAALALVGITAAAIVGFTII